MRPLLRAGLLLGSLAFAAGEAVAAADLRLAQNGTTAYQVVKPEQPSPVDEYAVTTLADFLLQKTGAAFPVVAPDQATPARPHLFIGLSQPMLARVGADPLAGLKDQQYVVRSVGSDVVLYGKGMHGNLYAVVDFMERTLGRRWYSGRSITETPRWHNTVGQPVFTVARDLVIQPFSRSGGFSFAYRMPSYDWMFDFHLQSGMNVFANPRFQPNAFSLNVMPVNCHTLFCYIPPSPRDQLWPKVFDWVEKKDYFATNPEYFTMIQAGRRVALQQQLCFSNRELRAELTRNVFEHIRRLKADGQKRLIIDVSANDDPSEFCFCPGCRGLKAKYGSPGGPLYDYLFELCAEAKHRHPDTLIHTLAYRLSQTQKPPIMPAGMAFPDNLVVVFANVEDNIDADWTHPLNRASYEDLLAWRKLTRHLWTWYYPFNGLLDRMVTDIRLMKAADVEGVSVEFTGGTYNAAIDFTELQIYVYNKLLQDVDIDVPALVREFTDYQYGPAAEGALAYLREMEAAWRASSTNTSLSAGRGISRRLTGVPPETMRRWQEAFDRMESLAAGDARVHQNVRRLRRGLDYRTLAEWNTLTKACPVYFSNYLRVKERLGAPPPWMINQIADWELAIRTAGIEKPLPPPFNSMDKALVQRFVPTRGRGNPKMVPDADAAFGYGAVVNLPDRPLTFGFYQEDTRTQVHRRAVDASSVPRDVYRLYPLGTITVTPSCRIWFSGSWETKLELGERLYRPPSPDNDNRYDVQVSLKFIAPIPPTPAEIAAADRWSLDVNAPYSVLVDQIIFVKLPPGAHPAQPRN